MIGEKITRYTDAQLLLEKESRERAMQYARERIEFLQKELGEIEKEIEKRKNNQTNP